jgi:hypothetical protein
VTKEDRIVAGLVDTFSAAVRLCRNRGIGELTLEGDAMGLLMDYALLLGVEGVAGVIGILAVEGDGEVVSRDLVALALGCWFEAQRLTGVDTHG